MRPNTPPPLERFRHAKQAEVLALQHAFASGTVAPVMAEPRPSFYAALHQRAGLPAVIAEYKRASPSRGWIHEHLSPEDVGPTYQQAGAAAVSVLTEEQYFHGHIDYLRRMHNAGVTLPLLRKDFIIDPVQVLHTATTHASALLLIVRLTPHVRLLRDLREQAEALGMDAVVEVFNVPELAMARESGARIIQVNARDLDSFTIDLQASVNLAHHYRHHNSTGGAGTGTEERWIAASGITSYSHLTAAMNVGFDAVLVGTSLMHKGQMAASLRDLLAGDTEATTDRRPQTC